ARDDDIERTGQTERLLDDPFGVVGAGDVAGRWCASQHECGHCRRLPVDVGTYHLRTLGRERGAARAPDPAGCAGDECRLALEARLHRRPYSWSTTIAAHPRQ